MKKAKFAVETKVSISHEPRSLVSGKIGVVSAVRVHPYGESFGYIYLIPGVGRERANVWLPERRLTKVR